MKSSTTRAFMAKKQSTSFAQVATNLLNVLQGYTKSLRLLLVMFLTLTVTTNAWGATYSKITTLSDLTTGDYVIVGYQKTSSYGRLISGDLNNKRLTYTSHYTSAPSSYTTTDATEIWHLEVTGTGDTRNVTIYNDDKEQYLNPGFAWDNSSTSWTVSYEEGFSFSSGTAYLGVNKDANYWRSYASSNLTNVNGIILLKAAASCTTPPTVSSASNSNITSTTATVSCSSGITSLGSAGCSIESYGFVYGTSSNPTISNTKVQVGTTYTTTGTAFSKELTGLTANTTYYVRPYATNGNGTAYGTQTSFTTPALPKYTVTLKDNDETLTQASAGASVTLPSRADCTGYTFAGWTKTWVAPQSSWTTTAPTIIPAGSYTPTANENLYPVYTKEESGGSTSYVLTAANAVTAGTYVIGITGSSGYYIATGLTGSTNVDMAVNTLTDVTLTNNAFTTLPTGGMELTFTGNNTDGFTISNSGGDKLSYSSYTNRRLSFDATGKTWKVIEDNSKLVLQSHNSDGYYTISQNGTNSIRGYASDTKYNTLYLFKKTGGSTTYYISVPDCTTEPSLCLIQKEVAY